MTVYIDPDYAGGGNNGTISAPWTAWDDFSFQAGETYAGQGGTTSTPTAQLNITVDNVTITSYGTGQHFIDPNFTVGAPSTKAIRIAAANVVIENLKVGIPNHSAGSVRFCIQSAAGSENLIIEDCTLVGESVDEKSICVDLLTGIVTPVTVRNNTFSGANSCLQLGAATVTPGAVSAVYGNTLTPNGNATEMDDSDGITCAGGANWNYTLHIYGNDISNFPENGIDLVAASNVLVYNNQIHDNFQTPLSPPSGMLLGASGGAYGGSKIYRNVFYNLISTHTLDASAINSRGGTNCEVFSNLIYDCDRGIYNGSADADDNSYYNNTIVDCNEGIRVGDSTTGITFINNICANAAYGVVQAAGSTVTYSYNLFHNMTTAITSGTPTDAGGNIEADPQLDNNYAPQGDSPCIGAGIQPLSLTDYNGDARNSLAGYDIGAVWFDGPSDSRYKRILASGGTR